MVGWCELFPYVQAAVDFSTGHLGFPVDTSAAPAFADVVRGPLRLLLSGPASSGARATPGDATTAGRNRIHLIVAAPGGALRVGAARPGSCGGVLLASRA